MNIQKLVEALVAGPEDGEAIWFRNNRITFKVRSANTGGSFGLWEAMAAPGDSPPLHIHHKDDESFFVIVGQMKVLCGSRTYEVGPGAFVFLPRGVPHSFLIE